MRKDQLPTEQEYENHVKQIIYSRAPYIYPCAKCGWAVEDGFCCSTCGTGDPRTPKEVQEQLEK